MGTHTKEVVFNVVTSPHNPIILGLPWLIKHNPSVDWQSCTLTFPDIPRSPIPRAPCRTALSRSYLVAKTPKSSGSLPTKSGNPVNLCHAKPHYLIKPCSVEPCHHIPGLATVKIAFVGAATFARAAPNHLLFAVYGAPTPKEPSEHTKLPKKYQDFSEVFNKKNANTLPKQCPYNC